MKKLLALVLALVMAMSLVTISNAAFADADEIDYTEAVEVMNAVGVLEGGDGNKFDPDGILTREQAAKIIAYMLLGKDGANSLSAASAPFVDVPADRWSAGAVAYCASEGILAGVGDGKFAPTETVTGYQFAKMLLVALGYDASIEGFTGSDWQINVAKLVIDLKLNDGMSGVVLSKGLTRQAAAKLAFNALDQYVVRYTGGVTVDAGNGTSVKVGATIVTTGNTFADVYFDDLSSTNPSDEYGRPATKWVWKNQAVGTYPKTAAQIYTADLDTTAGKKTVKADLSDYQVTAALSSAYGKTTVVAPATAAVDTDDIAAVTANGQVVEIFVSKNVITDVVIYDYDLVTVSKVEKDKVTLSDGKYIDDSEDLFDSVKNLSKGDKLMVYENGSTVVEAYEPTTVTGTYTLSKSGKYTVGGEAYEAQCNYANIATDLADGDLGDVFTLTLDKFGYVVDVEDGVSADAKTYALVLDTDEDASRGDRNWGAKLLLTDGTKVWADVASIDGEDVDDLNSGDLDALVNDFVSYEVKNGKYELNDLTSDTKTDVTAITKGDSDLYNSGAIVGSNKTVFVMKNADKSYTVYTGIKNVPTVTSASTYTLVNSGVALVVVVDTFSTTGAQDQVFLYKAAAEGTRKDGSDVIKAYKAIVNGEDTTVEVKSGTSNILSGANGVVGLYLDSGYTKGYITSASAAVSSSDSTKVYTGYSDGLSTLKLKDGILTIDATADVSKVVADEFNAWYIKATSAKVEELTLDKDDTMTDLGITAATGDYVIVILDDDGYATDLYLVDADA